MPLEYPLLSNSISVDVQKLNEFLEALTKLNPTEVDGISAGAKRLVEVSSGKWQWQEYNGSSWAAVPFLQHNVDQLDGYHAAITPAANTVAVRNASGVLEDSITGNAATASSAATLSQTLPVNKGGTGATTSEAARSNLGVPPTSHASTATTYGVGNATQYGHLKLSDAANSSSGVTGGVAATPAAVKAAKDAANNAQSSADAAMTKASTLATSSTPGIVKPGTGMTVDAAGALNVLLNNAVTSTSTTQAATANAVKTAYDKGYAAQETANVASSAAAEAQSAADAALEAAQAATSSSGKVQLKGTRSTTGNWTITGLVENKPLFILASAPTDSCGCKIEITSGSLDGTDASATKYESFYIGRSGNEYLSTNCFICVPTSSSVTLTLAVSNSSMPSFRAYQ